MEPHAVPQDILNTEFKLFGGFTLKQFLKLVGACLVALLIFIFNIPLLIKLPLIFISIIIGIGLATMPRFGAWLSNYTKAIFISPRYVWVKEDRAPEVLTSKSIKKIQQDKSVAKAKAKQKITLEDISLDALLATRDDPMKSTIEEDEPTVRDKNFDRLFSDLYKNAKPKLAPQPKPVQKPKMEGAALLQRARTQNKEIQTNTNSQQQIQKKTKEDYINEINKLKISLQNLVKDETYKEKESEILHKINDLMQEVKMFEIDNKNNLVQETVQTNKANPETKITDFKGKDLRTGQFVFGIVVDKNNKPISDAKVVFDDVGGPRDVLAVTDQNGKFTSTMDLLPGDYSITIQHPEHKFHSYKISVTDQKLPAYKLRER